MRKRILLVSLGITIISLILLTIGSAETFYNTLIGHSEEYLKVYMNEYTSDYAPDDVGAKALSEKLGGARVTFMDLSGTVTGDSESSIDGAVHSDRDEVREAIVSGEGFSVRDSATIGKNMIYYCKKIDNRLVRIAICSSSQFGIMIKSMPTLIWLLLVDVFFCFVFTYIGTFYILKPVEELAAKSGKNEKITTKYDEFEPIAEILNKRNEEITEKIEELKQEKDIVIKIQNSKDEFISNITHEMNTPLTGICGFAELLAKEDLSEEQKKKAAENILTQSGRLSELIKNVINYNEIDSEELPLYEVNIGDIARDTVEVLSPAAKKKNIEITTDIDSGIILKSRYEVISEILGNLIKNAIQYNKEGGKISVTVKGGDEPFIEVTDTGIGVSEENMTRIFDRFYTVDKSHSGKNGGFGLGLAIVKKLCNKAGWKITASSVVGSGTTFKIVI